MPGEMTKLEYIAVHLASAICAASFDYPNLSGKEEARTTPAEAAVKVYYSVLDAITKRQQQTGH